MKMISIFVIVTFSNLFFDSVFGLVKNPDCVLFLAQEGVGAISKFLTVLSCDDVRIDKPLSK